MPTKLLGGLTVDGVPVTGSGVDALPITGNVFYVNSSTGVDDPSYGTTVARPFDTLDYAIGKCTASNGDVIYLLPGHTETIGSASAITVDVAGISIIGLGNGNLRPTFTWSATAGTIVVSAANVTIKNIICTISIDEVVSMWSVTGAGVTLDAVDFKPYASGQAIQFLTSANTADQLTIKNCRHRQTAAATANQVWFKIDGVDDFAFLNNDIWITAKAATASICVSGSAALIQCRIVGNRIAWLGATITSIINLVTTSTGVITDNRLFGGAAVLLAAAITGDACYMAENYVSNTAAASGALAPGVDTVT